MQASEGEESPLMGEGMADLAAWGSPLTVASSLRKPGCSTMRDSMSVSQVVSLGVADHP